MKTTNDLVEFATDHSFKEYRPTPKSREKLVRRRVLYKGLIVTVVHIICTSNSTGVKYLQVLDTIKAAGYTGQFLIRNQWFQAIDRKFIEHFGMQSIDNPRSFITIEENPVGEEPTWIYIEEDQEYDAHVIMGAYHEQDALGSRTAIPIGVLWEWPID